MAGVLVGSARIDERGKTSGGAAGDQTKNEVGTQNWYKHSKGWVVIRAKDATVRAKIAAAMVAACANNNIGYDQSNRNGLYNSVKSKGFNPANCTVATETDCSALVRVCCCYAGIVVGDFNTSSELNVLKATGKFDVYTDSKYTASSDYLLAGDILVTRTKGHTVVVINNGPKSGAAKTASGKPCAACPVIQKGSKGAQAELLQRDLNYVLKTNIDVDGDFGSESEKTLKQWQKKYGLPQTGVYDPACYDKMRSLL